MSQKGKVKVILNGKIEGKKTVIKLELSRTCTFGDMSRKIAEQLNLQQDEISIGTSKTIINSSMTLSKFKSGTPLNFYIKKQKAPQSPPVQSVSLPPPPEPVQPVSLPPPPPEPVQPILTLPPPQVQNIEPNHHQNQNHPDLSENHRTFIPLPPRTGSIINEPPNFLNLVAELEELGFSNQQSQNALRYAYYNIERAANYLLTGFEVNDPLVSLEFQNHQEYLRSQYQAFEEFKSFLTETGRESKEGLISSATPKNQDSPINTSQQQQLTNVNNSMESYVLSDEEKIWILRLENKGFDRASILQTYFALSRNQIQTELCLKDYA